jgi:hypothetical protein
VTFVVDEPLQVVTPFSSTAANPTKVSVPGALTAKDRLVPVFEKTCVDLRVERFGRRAIVKTEEHRLDETAGDLRDGQRLVGD